MFILGGFAFLPLQQYIHHYVDILGKSFIVLGIILILFPFIQIFFKSNTFKEREVFYTFKDNGMIYQEEFIFNFFIYQCYRLFIIGLTTWLFSYFKTI